MMSKYTVSLDFDISVKNAIDARRLAEFIENLVVCQLDDKELFVALEGAEIVDIYDWCEDD